MSVLLKQDDGVELHLQDVTIQDITDALEYQRHQRSLQQAKYKRLYIPTGNPIGRPRKNPKPEESDQPVVKKSVGRPKKEKPTTQAPPEIPTGQDS